MEAGQSESFSSCKNIQNMTDLPILWVYVSEIVFNLGGGRGFALDLAGAPPQASTELSYFSFCSNAYGPK